MTLHPRLPDVCTSPGAALAGARDGSRPGTFLRHSGPPMPCGKPHGRSQPCRIRGVDYPSQGAAARALGVSGSAVSSALDRGRADHIGLGQPRGADHSSSRPVYMNGRRWRSMTEAAGALGVTVAAVSKAVKQGRARVRPKGERHV